MDAEKVQKPEKIHWVRGRLGEIVGAIVDDEYYYNMPEVWANEYLHRAYHDKMREDSGEGHNSDIAETA